jgi:DNA-binding transcriptional regulator YdaS (Cro superfamily)
MTFDTVAFRQAFPAFSDTPDAAIQAWASIVSQSPMASWFACSPVTQQQLIVAHIGALLSSATAPGNSQGNGAITSATEGSVSASFVAPPVKDGLEYYLSSSTYGQMLWAMLNVSAAGGVYVGGLPERRAYRKVGGVFC